MFLKLFFIGLIGFLAQFVFKSLIHFDIHKRVYNHRPGECRQVVGIENGSEDLEFIESKGIVFVTSGIVYLPPPDKPVTVKGKIFVYDFNQPKGQYKAREIPVNGITPSDFHPHGSSHWILKDGTIRLFLTAHSDTFKHAVFILDYDEKKQVLNHVRTVRDEKFVRPNDIVATGEDSFIVSNDGTAQSSLWNTIEILSGYNGGSLVNFDGKVSSYIIEKTTPLNGIIFSRDRKKLFVSQINKEVIGVYNWDEKKKEVSLLTEVPLLTMIDNFYIDNDGSLWTGAHPVLKDAIGHFHDASDLSIVAPSQVLRVEFSKDFKTWEVTEVLADDGRLVSASSIAIPFEGKQLLVGTVARKLLHCDLDNWNTFKPVKH